jgi:hypothetical protein
MEHLKTGGESVCIVLPLKMNFVPKEDITAYELAQCMQYFYCGPIMPHDIDLNEPHLRHFEITDPNKKSE